MLVVQSWLSVMLLKKGKLSMYYYSKNSPEISIEDGLKLMCLPGQVYELRIPNTSKGTISGYFTDFGKMAQWADNYSQSVPGVYFTLNPVNKDYLALTNNRVKQYAKTTTPDTATTRRCLLLIDADPERTPKEVSSTDEEHEAAIARAKEVRSWLEEQNFPAPILADSGNGGHLIYAIDLPNSEENESLA